MPRTVIFQVKNANTPLIVFGNFFSEIPIYYELPLSFHLIFLVNDEFDSHSPLFLAANWYYVENMDINHY